MYFYSFFRLLIACQSCFTGPLHARAIFSSVRHRSETWWLLTSRTTCRHSILQLTDWEGADPRCRWLQILKTFENFIFTHPFHQHSYMFTEMDVIVLTMVLNGNSCINLWTTYTFVLKNLILYPSIALHAPFIPMENTIIASLIYLCSCMVDCCFSMW